MFNILSLKAKLCVKLPLNNILKPHSKFDWHCFPKLFRKKALFYMHKINICQWCLNTARTGCK